MDKNTQVNVESSLRMVDVHLAVVFMMKMARETLKEAETTEVAKGACESLLVLSQLHEFFDEQMRTKDAMEILASCVTPLDGEGHLREDAHD